MVRNVKASLLERQFLVRIETKGAIACLADEKVQSKMRHIIQPHTDIRRIL